LFIQVDTIFAKEIGIKKNLIQYLLLCLLLLCNLYDYPLFAKQEDIRLILFKTEEYHNLSRSLKSRLSYVHDFGDEIVLATKEGDLEHYPNSKVLANLSAESQLLLVTSKQNKTVNNLQLKHTAIYSQKNVYLIADTHIDIDNYPLNYSEYQIVPLKLTEVDTVDDSVPLFRYHNYQTEVLDNEITISLTEQLDQEYWSTQVSSLENFGTRYFLNPNRYYIVSHLYEELKSIGFNDVVVDSFFIDSYNWGGFEPMWQSNIIAKIQGNKYPDEHIVVGGHYDSIISTLYGDPMIVAPGADDNGSGAAGVLELARLIKEDGYSPNKSILFLLFGAEEIGLKGSTYLAEKFRNEKLRIDVMINNDMIANYNNSSHYYVKVHPYTNSLYLSDITANIMSNHTSITPVISTANNPASDSYPFWVEGYPTIFFHEYDFSPFYHSPEDLLVNCDPEYAMEIVKATLLTMLYFDTIPASIDNLVISDVGTGDELLIEWSYPNMSDLSHFNVYVSNSPNCQDLTYQTQNNYIFIDNLNENETYYLGVAAVSKDGYEGVVVESSHSPQTIPIPPENFIIQIEKEKVSLNWSANKELDVVGYNIYRSTKESNLFKKPYVTNHNLTFYSDYDLKPKEYQYYAITALDKDGNESDPSSIIKSRLFSLDQGILVLNLTSTEELDLFTPDPSSLFALYDDVLSNYHYDYIDKSVDKEFSLLDLAPYSSVVLIDDSIVKNDYSEASTLALSSYLQHNGNLLIAGFKTLESFTPQTEYPYTFESDDFIYKWLKVEEINYTLGARFSGAIPLSEQPTLSIDDSKTYQELNSHIIGVSCLTPTPDATPIYSYGTNYPTDTPFGSLYGRTVGLSFSDNYKLVLLSFPLYYCDLSEVTAFVDFVVQDYFEEDVWPFPNKNILTSKPLLLANYPNPFTATTTIPFYLNEETELSLNIYNIKGERVKKLFTGVKESGRHILMWDGVSDSGLELSTGIYLCELALPNSQSVIKIMKIK